ncbi:HAMP domain-containing sensor histidine kinase [Diplocloster hominis]|uniref:sensor histidine kinase n=1 Tax=Diplocloster hominis TaxID=3079010 RepID=UPI0031BAD403
MEFRMGRTYRRLNEMLDQAMEGKFEESRYDESELSRLEARWKQFLSSSQLSARKVQEDRQNLQSLVSDISHQTRTPLSNILLYTQLLEEKEGMPEDAGRLIGAVRGQAEKLEFLIQSLVMASRLESGILKIEPVLQPVGPVVFDAAAAIEARAGEKQIRVVLEKQDSLNGQLKGQEITAAFDRKWTCEALYNLLDNAVKYTHEGDTIRMGIQEYEMFVRIFVVDHGIGISEDELGQIFQRFYRGKDVRDREGVGIGLYLARSIVEKQDGYLKAVSLPEKGSEFSIFLPKSFGNS